MDQSSSPDIPSVTQVPAWLGPLVAGCCFALGYGITHRVLTLQSNAEDPVPEAFTKLAFPGASLQKIRAQFGEDDASLEVDVTALEAANPVSQWSRRCPNLISPCRLPTPRHGRHQSGLIHKPLLLPLLGMPPKRMCQNRPLPRS